MVYIDCVYITETDIPVQIKPINDHDNFTKQVNRPVIGIVWLHISNCNWRITKP